MRKPLSIYSDAPSGDYSQNDNPDSMETENKMDGVSPSESVIRRLMDYSRSLAVIQTREECFFAVMN